MRVIVSLLLVLLPSTAAKVATLDNYEDLDELLASGKTSAFIKFFAPWCESAPATQQFTCRGCITCAHCLSCCLQAATAKPWLQRGVSLATPTQPTTRS